MTHLEIENWLKEKGILLYIIHPSGVVDVTGDVDLNAFPESYLPVQFGTITGSFDIGASSLKSLKGAPRYVGEHCLVDGSTISSIEGIPEYIGGDLSAFKTEIKSISGIDKLVKHIGGTVYLDESTTHILGLLRIDGVQNVDVDFGSTLDKIMEKHLKTRDLISAQDELIEAGFVEQAKL